MVKRAKFICFYKSEHDKELGYLTKTMQLKDFPIYVIKKAISDTLRHKQILEKYTRITKAIKNGIQHMKKVSQKGCQILVKDLM